MEEKNVVYMLECRDGSFYTGWTNHLEQRVTAHNEGRGAKYTRGRGPVKLVHCETFATKEEAMRREYAIKQMSRKEKEALIRSGEKGTDSGGSSLFRSETERK
jgi:putative endonuclease